MNHLTYSLANHSNVLGFARQMIDLCLLNFTRYEQVSVGDKIITYGKVQSVIVLFRSAVIMYRTLQRELSEQTVLYDR